MGRTRRRKKHTQKLTGQDEEEGKTPKAFVIERGKVGHVLSQLVLDLRRVMEPHTATRLKVQRKNVLKDFVSVAGPLNVTHLIMVSRTSDFINLKMCVLPRGPTLTFHIKAFCLAREVLASLKTPATCPSLFLTSPMLVLNNFNGEDKASHLLSTVMQNMFPAINVHTVNLSDIRRCLLLNSDPETKRIELRHYAIRVVPRGVSQGVKKLSQTHLPNLGKYSDISEYLLSGYGSESDGEEVGGASEVTLPQQLLPSAKAEQNTIKLTELGPRLTLELVKIEAGLCEGEVLHHAYIHKTVVEKQQLHVRKERARRLKERRRREQEANVARKRSEREQHKARCLAGMGAAGEQEEQEGASEEEDREWYVREVGEEPDPDTFGSSGVRSHRKRASGLPPPRAKKLCKTAAPEPTSRLPKKSFTDKVRVQQQRTKRYPLGKGQRLKGKGHPLQKGQRSRVGVMRNKRRRK